ncbi:MAG: hypothetical protein JWO53_959 [Chlamydiia bacterium]|nr:hypothetical protein [Chlamydiia bacterium]
MKNGEILINRSVYYFFNAKKNTKEAKPQRVVHVTYGKSLFNFFTTENTENTESTEIALPFLEIKRRGMIFQSLQIFSLVLLRVFCISLR